MSKTELKELSRSVLNGDRTIEAINAGSLQRIAAATEVMAKNHNELIRERDQYRRWYREEREENRNLLNKIRSLKGWVTRLKN